MIFAYINDQKVYMIEPNKWNEANNTNCKYTHSSKKMQSS